MARVLIIDDEPAIARALRPALQGHDFQVAVAPTAAEGLAEIGRFQPDLILLDLGLPDMEGLAALGVLRQYTAVPIIILSVRGAERDKIAALDRGADDYLTKPFSIGELLARLRVALRHTRLAPAAAAPGPILVGDLLLDPAAHTLTMRGVPVHLSPTEWNLLEVLARHAGRLVTHRTLLHTVWGSEYVGETQLLRVYINQLRAKLEAQPQRPAYILTEPGIGYRFRDPD